MICKPCRDGGEMIAAVMRERAPNSDTGGLFNSFLIEAAKKAHAECVSKKGRKNEEGDLEGVSDTQCDCQHRVPRVSPREKAIL